MRGYCALATFEGAGMDPSAGVAELTGVWAWAKFAAIRIRMARINDFFMGDIPPIPIDWADSPFLLSVHVQHDEEYTSPCHAWCEKSGNRVSRAPSPTSVKFG